LSGTVTARQTGNRVVFTIRFTYPEKHCSGLVTGRGDLADGGRLFEGGLRVTGECSGAEPEEGTFSLWRRP